MVAPVGSSTPSTVSSDVVHGVALIVSGVALGVIGVLAASPLTSYIVLGAACLIATAEIIRLILNDRREKEPLPPPALTGAPKLPLVAPAPAPVAPVPAPAPVAPVPAPAPVAPVPAPAPAPVAPVPDSSLPIVPYTPPDHTPEVQQLLAPSFFDPTSPVGKVPSAVMIFELPPVVGLSSRVDELPDASVTVNLDIGPIESALVPSQPDGWMTTTTNAALQVARAAGMAGIAITGQQIGQGIIAVHAPPLLLRYFAARAGGGITGYLIGLTAVGTVMPTVITVGGAACAVAAPAIASLAARAGAKVITFAWDTARQQLALTGPEEMRGSDTLLNSWVVVVVD